MVHLNRHPLKDTQLDALFAQLNAIVAKCCATQASTFLSELLGKEERIMLAKRLACIILLAEGKSQYYVGRTLKISPSTAEKVKRTLDGGGYDSILRTLRKSKKQYVEVLNTLETILHLGGIMPRRYGLDRYRYFK